MTDKTQIDGDSSTQAKSDLVGATFGDYRVLRLLGRGGMGEVYLAEQLSLRRSVALKVLKKNLIDDEQYLRRFEAEAKAVAPISHANIVSVYAIGEASGVRFIAMEYVAGMNLREYLNKKGALDLPTCLTIMRKVAAALQCASEHNIVHRDIKPENVLLSKKGEVKVADFGLSRQLTSERVDLTQTGVTMGTPLYMSPEQVEGRKVDHRSDIYSFGVMCYHMIAGFPPYRGETAMAVAIQHVSAKPAPLGNLRPDLPADLLRIVEKMMAKRVEDRYQTSKQVIRELNRLRSGELDADGTEPIDLDVESAADNTYAGKLRRWAHRSRLKQFGGLFVGPKRSWTAIAASLVLALTAGAALGLTRREPNHLKKARSLTNTGTAQVPDISGIQLYNGGYFQLEHARKVAKPSEQEAAYWAVILKHAPEDDFVIAAAQTLANRYLSHGQYDKMELLAQELLRNQDYKIKMFGQLFNGIAKSRQGEARQSMASFDEMFAEARRPLERGGRSFTEEQRIWLTRQYYFALKVNCESLNQTFEPQKSIKDFNDSILRARGVPRRPPAS